jgi:hypothetical protein
MLRLIITQSYSQISSNCTKVITGQIGSIVLVLQKMVFHWTFVIKQVTLTENFTMK